MNREKMYEKMTAFRSRNEEDTQKRIEKLSRVFDIIPDSFYEKYPEADYVVQPWFEFLIGVPWNAKLADSMLQDLMDLGFEITMDTYYESMGCRTFQLSHKDFEHTHGADIDFTMFAIDGRSVCTLEREEYTETRTRYRVNCGENV